MTAAHNPTNLQQQHSRNACFCVLYVRTNERDDGPVRFGGAKGVVGVETRTERKATHQNMFSLSATKTTATINIYCSLLRALQHHRRVRIVEGCGFEGERVCYVCMYVWNVVSGKCTTTQHVNGIFFLRSQAQNYFQDPQTNMASSRWIFVSSFVLCEGG